ncbi:cysteine hydrolase family protein [Amycolatopsis anabasis]|uniref:cysteine hydrolase family protein n=1 Tax=Amycolatopsis anabasis TaxID=1840409 RepID=UPI0015D45EAD|nr:cysteine hydrolase family protein [Amycolatopsis anabasis]
MGSALLIIDMQDAIVPGIWRGAELVDRIAALVESARARGVPVIAVQQTGPAGTPLAEGSPGWQLSPRLGVRETDPRVRKQATDSFFRTELADLLAARAVDTVVITGVATDYCVDATARSALSHGLDVDLVSDGHAPMTDGDPAAGLTPQQVVEHHNGVLSRAVHPGGRLRLVPAADCW